MKYLIPIICVVCFTVVYFIFIGSIDSHFWLPFILIIVATSGLGKIHLWGEKK